jgi:hypothetical protein
MAGLRFTAEEWAAAVEPPTFTVGARTYSGRVHSIEEWLPHATGVERGQRGELTDAETAAAVRRLVEAMFPPDPAPPPRRSLRRRVIGRALGIRATPPPALTPADVFCALAWPVQLAFLANFSRCQAQLLKPTTRPSTAPTRSGTPPRPGRSDNGGSASDDARPRSAATPGRSSTGC